jgi:hypothetical protein
MLEGLNLSSDVVMGVLVGTLGIILILMIRFRHCRQTTIPGLLCQQTLSSRTCNSGARNWKPGRAEFCC